MRVRRPGGNQPQQLREPAISPNSNPSGGTQEQVFRLSVRESVSAPGLAAFRVAAPRGPEEGRAC